jgi:hypothetical protein
MARKRKKAKKAKKGTARGHVARAELSKKRGHKPVKLLVALQVKMSKNIGKLDNLIKQRMASGE